MGMFEDMDRDRPIEIKAKSIHDELRSWMISFAYLTITLCACTFLIAGTYYGVNELFFKPVPVVKK